MTTLAIETMSDKKQKRKEEADVAPAAETETIELEPFDEEGGTDESMAEEAGIADTDEVLAPAEKLEAVEAERDALKDQLLRVRADFDNFRKRTARDLEQLRKTAAQTLIGDLLPILDNLERALGHIEDKSQGLAQGMEMVKKQFIDMLNANGVDAIPALGEGFDPNVHEALSHQPSEEYAADVVAVEFQRGYTMGGQVLRPAKVVVSSGPCESGAETENAVPEKNAK